jgi:hypothetical protein
MRRAEPAAEADRGRHPGFPSFNVFADGPGILAEHSARKTYRMIEPLPAGVVEQLLRDFGSCAEPVAALLLACRRLGGPDYIGDRLMRCIMFAARRGESRVPRLIEQERQDFRDIMMAAEYDALRVRHLRDFNRPFGIADIAEPP